MKKIAVLVVDGVEEIECLATVDYCRRAGIDVTTASVTGSTTIHGSHGVDFRTDVLMDEVDYDGLDGLVFPGGPGTHDLGDAPGARDLAKQFLEDGRMLAAICAAPGMLSETGLLKGRTATGYPGCKPAGMACWTENTTEVDGNLITGKGPGAATYFALEIIGYLCGEDVKKQISDSTQMPSLS